MLSGQSITPLLSNVESRLGKTPASSRLLRFGLLKPNLLSLTVFMWKMGELAASPPTL